MLFTELQLVLLQYNFGGLSAKTVLWIFVLSLVLPWICLIFGVRPQRVQDHHAWQQEQQVLRQEHERQEQAQHHRLQDEDDD
jgi:hypothetical protein